MPNPLIRALRCAASLWLGLMLLSCGGGREAAPGGTSPPTASSGQVAAVKAYKVSYYAAARFADQASFGPTPALIEALRSKGFEQWIDEQLALPVTPIEEMKVVLNWNVSQNDNGMSHNAMRAELMKAFLSAPDQLRWRATWSLSQYFVISVIRVEPAALIFWANDLYRLSLGNYAQLIRDVSTSAPMGFYLDNAQNRPKSAQCPSCAPNENYARELLQLFTLGVVKLNADGSTVRDNRGRPVQTYSQRDVDELARALTGWRYDPVHVPDTPRNWGNWPKRMLPDTNPASRDSGQKLILGRSFAAGQSHQKDLDDVVAMLMQHPNIAPFVVLRFIQHLVKSDPTPAYIARIGAVFRGASGGQAGDMKAVIKAVLLDPEARRGDDPSQAFAGDGKLREPMLQLAGLLRGLGCTAAPIEPWSNRAMVPAAQDPFMQESVFGFYAPTDRAPGSNLLAPEQKLINSSVFFDRLWHLNYMVQYNGGAQGRQAIVDAGCRLDEFVGAYRRSTADLAALIGTRWLRGLPPADLARVLADIDKVWRTASRMTELEIVIKLIEFALIGAGYGAMT